MIINIDVYVMDDEPATAEAILDELADHRLVAEVVIREAFVVDEATLARTEVALA